MPRPPPRFSGNSTGSTALTRNARWRGCVLHSMQFRFKPLAENSMADRINFICAQEGLTLQPGVMGTLGTAAGGDMRKAITILQSSSRLYGATSPPHRGCVCAGSVHRKAPLLSPTFRRSPGYSSARRELPLVPRGVGKG